MIFVKDYNTETNLLHKNKMKISLKVKEKHESVT